MFTFEKQIYNTHTKSNLISILIMDASKSKIQAFILSVFIFCNTLFAQMTMVVETTPLYFTPLLDSIFLAGSFNTWDPGNESYILNKNADGSYSVNLDGTDGETIEFKFTRGDWDRVETSASGADIANRTATFSNGDTLYLDIANWHDQSGTHTIAGDVFQLDYNFYMPELNRTRRIWIYLPPDYFTSTNDYPVIYMHDGQNVFDYASSFAGEWDVDGTMENIFSLVEHSCIVVAIANGEIDRIDEYSPWVHPSYGGGDGDLYAQFIVNELKPYIDANYRTKPERENTAIGGSSLGGLISYYMVLQYDEVFGKAILMSPSFWFADEVDSFAADFVKEYPFKIYITAGLYEDEDMVPDIDEVVNALQENGFTDEEIISVIRSDGAHSEWFWKREFDDACYWLFDLETPADIEFAENPVHGFYDAGDEIFYFSDENLHDVLVYDIAGRVLAHEVAVRTFSFSVFQPGMYFLRAESETQKIIIR